MKPNSVRKFMCIVRYLKTFLWKWSLSTSQTVKVVETITCAFLGQCLITACIKDCSFNSLKTQLKYFNGKLYLKWCFLAFWYNGNKERQPILMFPQKKAKSIQHDGNTAVYYRDLEEDSVPPVLQATLIPSDSRALYVKEASCLKLSQLLLLSGFPSGISTTNFPDYFICSLSCTLLAPWEMGSRLSFWYEAPALNSVSLILLVCTCQSTNCISDSQRWD